MRLFKELYKIEFGNDQKNIYSVKVRDVDGTNTIKNFDSPEEADRYYGGLDKKKEELKKDEHIKSIDDEIRSYVLEYENKQGVTSARHLNVKFKLKLSQKEYNEILGL